MTTTPAVTPRTFLASGTVGQTVLATFANRTSAMEAALDAVALAMPLSVDLLDHAAVAAVSRYADLAHAWEGGSVLVIGLSANTDPAGAVRACTRHDASALQRCTTETEIAATLTLVRAARPALEACGHGLRRDVTVPVSQLPHLVRRVESIQSRIGVDIGVIAQPGSGAAAVYVLCDGPADERVRMALAALELTIEASPFAWAA